MSKGIHGKPPNNQSAGVSGILLLIALAIAVATIMRAAHGMKDLLDALAWTRR